MDRMIRRNQTYILDLPPKGESFRECRARQRRVAMRTLTSGLRDIEWAVRRRTTLDAMFKLAIELNQCGRLDGGWHRIETDDGLLWVNWQNIVLDHAQMTELVVKGMVQL